VPPAAMQKRDRFLSIVDGADVALEKLNIAEQEGRKSRAAAVRALRTGCVEAELAGAVLVAGDAEVVGLANVGAVHVIKIGPELVDLTKLAMPPSVVPSTANGDVFTIAHNGKFKVENFNTFAAFVTQLTADLAGTATGTMGMTSNMPATVEIIAAAGQYDTAKNVFTATRLAVLLSN